MYCPVCKHPLVSVPAITLTEKEPAKQFDTQCTVCRAVFRMNVTLLHATELKPEQLAERLAKQQKPMEPAPKQP
jgi:hypothetical protein